MKPIDSTVLPLDWDRPFLVGEAPNRNWWDSNVLLGSAWRRFGRPLGLTVDEFAAFTDRVNVFAIWQGKEGKGDRFPIKEARDKAFEIMRTLGKRRCVILLGRRVAKAFGLEFRSPFRFRVCQNDGHRFRYATCPHPSGINRWWNDSANRREAERFFKEVLR